MKARQSDPAEHGMYERTLDLDTRTLDLEARTVDATLSTEHKVDRFFGFEQLDHAPKAIDLKRATRGLPLLFSHDQTQPIGRAQNLRIADGQLRATLRFSENARAEEVFRDVQSEILTDVSVGYRVHQWEEVPEGRIARRWELLEASVVAVPADPAANIHRNEDTQMPEPTPAPDNVTPDRRGEVFEVFRAFPGEHELLARCMDDESITADAARALLLRELGARAEPVSGASVSAGEDAAEKFSRAMSQALAVKFDADPDPTGALNRDSRALVDELKSEYSDARARAGENPLAGMSLIEMAKEHARTVGGIQDAGRWRPTKAADYIFNSRAMGALIGHGPDDFTNLLANNQGKMLQVGYTEAPETWQAWCRTSSLNDFKTANRPVMSTFGDLDDVTGDKEYQYGTFSDRQETITLTTFGKLFSISRTAIINDDQSAFSEIPRAMGRAAARMVGDSVYDLLLNNAALSDGTALFHADHSNLTASGAAPSAAQLNTAYSLMALQTDPASNVLNIAPRYIIVPPQLWGTTRTLLVSSLVPGGSNNDVNIYAGSLEQVTEPRIGDTGASPAGSAVIWYLAAAPSSVGTVEVGFLNGNQSPYLEEQNGFSRDGAVYKVRLDFGSTVLDHRGLYKNAGA